VLQIRIRDQVPFWPLDPGSGIGFFRIPDPNLYFWELSDNFLGKKFYNPLKIAPIFFLQHFKNKIIYNFVKFVAMKKVWQHIFFSTLSFVAVFGSGIRDGQNENPGFGINIPVPRAGHICRWCCEGKNVWVPGLARNLDPVPRLQPLVQGMYRNNTLHLEKGQCLGLVFNWCMEFEFRKAKN
jgi:hypothetical protein